MLRSMAIAWWIGTSKMTGKNVQLLARLKTPGRVAANSRNNQMNDYDWLEEGQSMVASAEPLGGKM